ncbi:unnamed protein product [Linum tenue]|uniref:Uncharacterized protein n=1 Tax=Linum tenue TaxID=586396 RepID=A0AAV0P594_9ROSI|nr:unnamed protein product [Linum tenue]CAI0465518.1 unnamed protein product [Linum tenue]
MSPTDFTISTTSPSPRMFIRTLRRAMSF